MPSAEITDRTIDGPHGPVPIRVYRPAEPQGIGLVWMHGGAFIMGDLDVPEADWTSRQLSSQGITVVSVDYRLAVEGVHFPVPLDDVHAAWKWALDNATELGVDESAWHAGGGSSGGNLAAALSVRLRDTDARTPRSSILVYPVLHDALPVANADLQAALLSAPADRRFDPVESVKLNINYAGDRAMLSHPWVFPINAAAAGLPPTLIINSDVDALRPSGEAYAAHLATGGIDVTLVREPGTWHGHLNDIETPGAHRTYTRIVTWLHTAAAFDTVAKRPAAVVNA